MKDMQQSKKLKFIFTFALIGFMIWFGGSIMRGVIAYDLFETTNNVLTRTDKSPAEIFNAIYYFSSMSIYTQTGYVVVAVSVILLNILTFKSIKKNGWIFMAIVLFYLFLPVEIIRMWYDYNLADAIFNNGLTDVNSEIFKDYFYKRYEETIFTTLFSMSLMSNLTSIIIVIWKPLVQKVSENTNES